MKRIISKNWYDELSITASEMKRLRFYKMTKASDESILEIFPEMNQNLLDHLTVEEIDRLTDKYPHATIFLPHIKSMRAKLHD